MEIKVEKTLANLSSELSAEEALINKTETDVVAMTTSEKHIRKKQNQKNTRNASKKKKTSEAYVSIARTLDIKR